VIHWPAYDRALVRRGDVTVWFGSMMISCVSTGAGEAQANAVADIVFQPQH
jgi:hypothetical protein